MNLKEILKTKDDIYQPQIIKEILALYGVSLKKRFGQNFLINSSIANYVTKLLTLDQHDRVVEIGPGLGAITLDLAKKSKEVVAFEIDRGIYRVIKDILKIFNVENVILINEDFLKISHKSRILISNFNKLVSNFPYSSGQRMVIKIIEEFFNFKKIIGTLQREVAERFTALPGNKNYGFISAWVQYVSNIRVKKIISPGNFYPKPEVESSIIEITPRIYQYDDYLNSIKRFIKCCFVSKRKSLVNNIISCKELLNEFSTNSKEFLIEKTIELFRDKNIRAEQLSYKDFDLLYNFLIGKNL